MILSELRKSRGLTQQALADKLGVRQTSVAMWEKGKALPRTQKLVELANILDVDIKTLLQSMSVGGANDEK